MHLCPIKIKLKERQLYRRKRKNRNPHNSEHEGQKMVRTLIVSSNIRALNTGSDKQKEFRFITIVPPIKF